MTAYYNEIDPYAAEWLRNLIAAGHIAPGDVDERSIADVRPDDLRPYTQCHFFAGIGVWSYALRRAGWPDELPVWTGSCPCQPFSAAGRGEGFADERHLWPVWRKLIDACSPTVVFGEQVASALSLGAQPPSGTDMRKLQDREALLGVLRELKGVAASRLQGLHSDRRAGQEGHDDRGAIGISSRVPPSEPCSHFDGAGEEPGGTERSRLRSGPAGDGGPLRYWSVLGDGHPVQSRRRSDVGQPVAGPDQSDAGVHDGELSMGAGLRERDGEHVGRGPDLAHCGNDGVEEGDGSAERGPSSFAGSELEEADFRAWIDLVQDDMEGLGYAFGAVPFPSAGVGAPHIRDRAYFVAYAAMCGRQQQSYRSGECAALRREPSGATERMLEPRADGTGTCLLADMHGDGRAQGRIGQPEARYDGPIGNGAVGGMGYAEGLSGTNQPERSGCEDKGRSIVVIGSHSGTAGRDGRWDCAARGSESGRASITQAGAGCGVDRPGPTNGFWRDPDWLRCRDGRWRPVEPGAQQMVDGSTQSLGRLRAEDIQQIEVHVKAWAVRHQRDGTEAVRDLWDLLSSEEADQRSDGGFDSVREAPFLLAFLRQLTGQGWRFPIGVERASAEASRVPVRVLRYIEQPCYSSRGRGLDEQPTGEPADPLRQLSQILAHHTEVCWGQSGWQDVGSFPLIVGAPARVGRLRAYGNAINAEAAAAFISASLDVLEDRGDFRLKPMSVLTTASGGIFD